MEQKGLRSGHIVALVGALAAFASLWRPWYTVEIPQQLRDMFSASGQVGQDPGLLGQLSRSLAASIPSSVSASGWRELEGGDLALAGCALAAVALVIAAAGALGPGVRVESATAGRLVALLGAVASGVALVHLVRRPGGELAADYVKVADGIWIAVAGGVAMLAGGLLAAAQAGATASTSSRRSTDPFGGAPETTFPRLDPELPPVFAPTPGAAAGSVAPPGA